MNKIFTAILTLVVTVVAGIILYDYQREEPDLRFTLSDSIPTSFFTAGKTANIQQLEIANVGDKVAEKITIKVNGKVQHYQLNKLSRSDKVDEFKSRTGIEIVYPELPPEGKISIILSSDVAIYESNVHIAYRNGQASKAFGQDGRVSLIEFLVFWGPFAIYVILVLRQSLFIYRDWYCKYYRNLNKNKKPWFLTTEKWIELRDKAITDYFKSDRVYNVSSVERLKSFTVLKSGKFEFLSESEWSELRKLAENEFEGSLSSLLSISGLRLLRLETLYQLNRPEYYSFTKWNEFKEKLDSQYIDVLISSALRSFVNAKTIEETINKQNSLNVSEDEWNRYQSFLKELYVGKLSSALTSKHDRYILFLEGHDLTGIDESVKNDLLSLAYELQVAKKYSGYLSEEEAKKFLEKEKEEWVKESDYQAKVKHAEGIVEARIICNKYYNLSKLLDIIISKKSLPNSKPDELSEKEWEEIQKLENVIVKDLSNNENILAEIHEKELKIPHLKDKLKKQLQLINDILNDPTAIDRVEDYEDTFAKGNYANLRKVSELLAGK
ncbi:hypothetical protein [Maridesulfovibrio ferrireducens]|uniref:hypothetical protein n=1 Tax=Maridesulfovibrio ferrireducens TaxID=246191 RepID=UPI001A2C0851|nr:hypothetical protein [Maridesulfovibrio ferrireducens]MBI9113042.1 hypothetical protein [Maridesulfovibrio ferrireducens]